MIDAITYLETLAAKKREAATRPGADEGLIQQAIALEAAASDLRADLHKGEAHWLKQGGNANQVIGTSLANSSRCVTRAAMVLAAAMKCTASSPPPMTGP